MDKTKKERLNQTTQDILNSTIPWELRVCYLLATSLELLSQDSFTRIKAMYAANNLGISDNEMLTKLTDYCKAVKQASYRFFNDVEPHVSAATFDAWDKPEDKVGAYDCFQDDANMVARLMLLFTDRCYADENWRKVFELLRKLPSKERFKDEDFARFKLK